MPRADRSRLNRICRELSQLRAGIIVPPGMNGTVSHAGPVPFPQTTPKLLGLRLFFANPTEWRGILANELLIYLERAHRHGHHDAAPDALDLCGWADLPVPRWALATEKKKQRGRSRQFRQEQFWKDLARWKVVELAADDIAAERADAVPNDRSNPRSKFERAKKRLENSWADTPMKKNHSAFDTGGIEDSHKRFAGDHDYYYFAPVFIVGVILRHSAPTVLEALLPPR